MSIKYGSQSFAWQMNYKKNKGNVPHILSVMKEAGFLGVEFETVMLGDYYQADAFSQELEKTSLTFSALALAQHWLGDTEAEDELQQAKKTIDFLKHFPGTKLILCQLPCSDRKNLLTLQKNHIKNIKAIKERAAVFGIECAYHTNSSSLSIFRSSDDYKVLFDLLHEAALGFAPDIGHIAHGGMNVAEILKECRPLIRHVHFKDIDKNGNWVSMGKGVIDFLHVVEYLAETDYNEWIIVEEESNEAINSPDKLTLENGDYMSRFWKK